MAVALRLPCTPQCCRGRDEASPPQLALPSAPPQSVLFRKESCQKVVAWVAMRAVGRHACREWGEVFVVDRGSTHHSRGPMGVVVVDRGSTHHSRGPTGVVVVVVDRGSTHHSRGPMGMVVVDRGSTHRSWHTPESAIRRHTSTESATRR